MKNYLEIMKEIEKNNNEIKAKENLISDLLNKKDIANAATLKERLEIKHSITDTATQKASELAQEVADLKSINKILHDNMLNSFAMYAENIIREIMKKYAGKQLGEKTREKIREAAKEYNISFYFSGYRELDTINVYSLRPDGCKAYNGPEISIYARNNNTRSFFVDSTNKIMDFSDIEFSNNYSYTEKPAEKLEITKKVYEEYKNIYEKAKKLQNELNSLLPGGTSNFDAIGYLSPWATI